MAFQVSKGNYETYVVRTSDHSSEIIRDVEPDIIHCGFRPARRMTDVLRLAGIVSHLGRAERCRLWASEWPAVRETRAGFLMLCVHISICGVL